MNIKKDHKDHKNKINMDINCQHFPICSGCRINQQVDQTKAYKEAVEFFSKYPISPFKMHVGSPYGWRTRAKLAVRGNSQQPLIGLFKEGSHDIVDIPFCKVHHPAINIAVDFIKKWIIINHISIYSETTGHGLIRYLQLAVERKTQKVQLTLVINEKLDSTTIEALCADLWNLSMQWHSIWINYNSRRDNVIFGGDWKLIKGEEWLWENLLHAEVCFHPASFAQANPEMFEKLLVRLNELIPQGTSLLEYYAGAGVIGLSLLGRCRRVCCVEVVPLAHECFMLAKNKLPEHLQERINYISGTAAKYVDLLKTDVDVVLVDPPRKGLEVEMLKALSQPISAKQLIYISCGWDSFQRDCKALLLAGWKLSLAEGYLFFPGSEHLETLAVFSR